MIKIFQLKAARSVTGIGVRELALYLGVSRTIVSRWEKQNPLDYIKTKKTNPETLVFFFKQHNIIFPNKNTIALNNKPIKEDSSHDILTRFQLRAARSIISLTQEELAKETKTSRKVINYLETYKNTDLLNAKNKEINCTVFKTFFKKNGISFSNLYSVEVNSKILRE